MKYLFVCLFFLSGLCSVRAQHMLSRQMPFFYQLSSNEIFDIHQDRTGYLWIGTTNGLARYDGYNLQTFRSDYKQLNLLTNNSIVSLADNSRYVWIGTQRGVNLYDKQTCRIVPAPDERLRSIATSYIEVDQNDTTWIAAEGKVYRCDPTALHIKEYELSTSRSAINSLYADRDNQLWALTYAGLFRYDRATDSFISYPRLGNLNAAYTLFQDHSGRYWIGTWGEGLWEFFPDRQGDDCYLRHHVLNPRSGETEPIFFSMTQDDTFGYLWLLSYGGLYALKCTDEGTLEQVDIHQLVDTQMMYTRIRKDREGNLWLASYDMAYTIFFDTSNIDNYPLHQFKEQTGWDANLLNLCPDEDGIVWMNQDRYGLCLYDPERDTFADVSRALHPGEADILLKSSSLPGVWMSARGANRLLRLTAPGMKVRIEEEADLTPLTQNREGIKSLAEDLPGNLWIATGKHVYLKPCGSSALEGPLPLDPPAALACDETGNCWMITIRGDLYRLIRRQGKATAEHKADGVPPLGPEVEIKHMCFDQDNCLWLISSLGQIFRWDNRRGEYRDMSLNSAIEDCSVLGLLADGDYVWIITNKKLLRYDIRREVCTDYATTDGNVLVDAFRYRAFSADERGGLYAGGHRGFMHIHSDITSQTGKEPPHTVITDVRVGDRSIFFSRSTSPANTVRSISLNPTDRNIEIFFSPLQYSLNAKYRAAYMLEGADNDWVMLGHDKYSAFYNELKKGTYKFRLKLEYEQGRWTEQEVLLTIHKAPAFYETWYAYLIYMLLAALCLYTAVRLYMRRIKQKSDLKLKEELTRTKLVYFTNVSHELLTPLTVISCVTDHLEQMPSASVQRQSAILRSNADKLKRLIQQVLDFRKMDVGKMKLNVSRGDIREFITGLCHTSILPLAQKKNILFGADFRGEDTCGYVDFDKLDTILYNLLSNAIKYTPEGRHVRLAASITRPEGRRMLTICVEDEGIGISPKEIDRIFNRFYSSKKSPGVETNGIGLSLTRDVVKLHHGTIAVSSTQGRSTTFSVCLPVERECYTADELAETDADAQLIIPADEPIADIPSADDISKPTLLLIDDNTELLYVMTERFKERFAVLKAANGEQAWEKLNNHAVDIILCDVMLPDANGWELCRRFKADMRFSHIPVIILTAKNGIDDRVASYEAGADGYVAKPFELKILSARVDNLIRASRMRQAAFRKEEDINLEALAYPRADKQFLQSIIGSIEQHLEETEFDLEQLATDVNMSKSTLYRKIKTMTGMTPLDFVRNVKMKRACMMLLLRTQNISEIAYAVGFSNPKYFSKCFKEEFGMTPSEYVQKHNQ